MPGKEIATTALQVALEEVRNEARPELDDDWFAEADLYHGNRLVRRGRPRSANPKEAISLRVDADVLAHYRGTGPGWQSRMNDELRKAAGL